jgi:hypothetical protein
MLVLFTFYKGKLLLLCMRNSLQLVSCGLVLLHAGTADQGSWRGGEHKTLIM